jgi:hypothetical protein
MVISSAGFARRTPFNSHDKTLTTPAGFAYPFPTALALALVHMLTRVVTPSWVVSLSRKIFIPFVTPFLKEMSNCFDDLAKHMLDVIGDARAAYTAEKKGVSKNPSEKAGSENELFSAALLRNLVTANMTAEGERNYLTDEELLSNTFVCHYFSESNDCLGLTIFLLSGLSASRSW